MLVNPHSSTGVDGVFVKRKTLLDKSPIIFKDTRRTMFCLSFLSIDRATAPGQYEQYVPNPKQ